MIQLRHRIERSDDPWFELGQESDGTLRILAMLSALHQQPPRTVIALEEPELNIHPRIMAKLWTNLAPQANKPNFCSPPIAQIWLDLCQADQLRVVENRNGLTLVGPLEEAQTEIIQANLFAPGQLFASPRIVSRRGKE